MGLINDIFGVMPDGREVQLVTLRGTGGIEMSIITYGAIVVSLEIPDRSGEFADVVLGHDDIDSYIERSPYFGAVIGRYANRIADGTFELNGVRYEVSRNEGNGCLHGGINGFDKAVWTIDALGDDFVRLTHTSSNGDQGFPGEMTARVTYTLTDADELEIVYDAVTTAPTVVNLTQHTYWNLAGGLAHDVLSHELTIAASHYIPVDDSLIPTGEILYVDGTPFDFRSPVPIGARINDDDQQLRICGGYDHNLVLDRQLPEVKPSAMLRDPGSGRTLAISTTEPGLQLYTGNRLDGAISGKRGEQYHRYGGVCLETQHFPNSPNNPRFPSTALSPRRAFRSRTVFAFSVT
ncbi:MAG TPA: aldose epimerase family protein [Gemmatimonadaceae bacterium]|nr:aldose epimerase family protein [Gemmatimonadaceae bacterium]